MFTRSAKLASVPAGIHQSGYRDTLTVHNLNAQSEYYTMQPAPGRRRQVWGIYLRKDRYSRQKHVWTAAVPDAGRKKGEESGGKRENEREREARMKRRPRDGERKRGDREEEREREREREIAFIQLSPCPD